MYLSEMRKELLRKNRDKIAALQKGEGEDIGGCLYKYPNGMMCAASACLTDDERDKVSEFNNGGWFEEVSHFVDVSESELDTIIQLQSAHDEYMLEGGPDNWDIFMKTLQSVEK